MRNENIAARLRRVCDETITGKINESRDVALHADDKLLEAVEQAVLSDDELNELREEAARTNNEFCFWENLFYADSIIYEWEKDCIAVIIPPEKDFLGSTFYFPIQTLANGHYLPATWKPRDVFYLMYFFGKEMFVCGWEGHISRKRLLKIAERSRKKFLRDFVKDMNFSDALE
jgi:hypothetical protein